MRVYYVCLGVCVWVSMREYMCVCKRMYEYVSVYGCVHVYVCARLCVSVLNRHRFRRTVIYIRTIRATFSVNNVLLTLT